MLFMTRLADGACFYLGTLSLALGYVGLLTLWSLRGSSALRDRFAAVGRMAFTNYIAQSVVTTLLFLSLRLYDAWDRAELFLVAAAVGVLQLAWSKPWLTRFRFGPLEWVWRCVTRWRLEPLLRSVDAPAAE